MSGSSWMLAEAILAAHLAVIAFNVAGLVVIPLGAWRGWAFVRAPLLRLLHLASWGAVAVQALLGRACFLTDWQDAASGNPSQTPLVMRWVNVVLFWPLPAWVFTLVYAMVFAYVVALLWLVPIGSTVRLARKAPEGD
ncbi:MAG TPA: DUF2784 domain-containing protein [Caulobacteraceae bacterium]|nr:DUF2784 domain-containing protein [Caulobacteraceae bacterium]